MLRLGRPPEDFLVAFLNTLDVEDGTDQCADDKSWRAWLAAEGVDGDGVDPDVGSRERSRDLRDELRSWMTGEGPISMSLSVSVVLQGERRPESEVVLEAQDPPGLVAVAIARLHAENRLDRVKICPADDCLWAFYDVSRNHSRTWCSMEECGNRAKARAFQARRRG